MEWTKILKLTVAVIAAVGIAMYALGVFPAREVDEQSKSVIAKDGVGEKLVDRHSPPAAVKQSDPVHGNARESKISKIYRAESLLELYAIAAEVDGERLFDISDQLNAANVFCNAMPGLAEQGRNSFVDFSGQLGSESDLSDEIIHSGVYLDQLRARFCSDGVDLKSPFSHQADWVVTVSEELKLSVLTDAIRDDFESDEEVDAARANLLAFIATTESPAAFLEAVSMLASDALIGRGWRPPGYTARSADFGLDNHKIGMLGAQLAYCRLAPAACRGNGINVVRRCLPANCRPNESLTDFLQRTHSPDVVAAAESYAAGLLRLRQADAGG
jgi:hypothetical protein